MRSSWACVTAVVCIAVVAAQGEESELIQNQVERAQLHEQLSHLIEDGTAIFNSWDAKDPLDIKEVAEPAKELAMEEKREQEVMVEEPVIYHTTEESKVSELAHDEEQKGSFGTSLDIRNFAKDLAPKAFAHKAPVQTDYDAIFSHAKVLPQSIETSATTKQKVFHPRRLERHVKKATKEKAAAKVRKAARRARRAKRHAARVADKKKEASTNKILHELLGTDEPLELELLSSGVTKNNRTAVKEHDAVADRILPSGSIESVKAPDDTTAPPNLPPAKSYRGAQA